MGLDSLRATGKLVHGRKVFPQESGQEWLERMNESQVSRGHLDLLLPSKHKHWKGPGRGPLQKSGGMEGGGPIERAKDSGATLPPTGCKVFDESAFHS